ncbi:HAD family hydrolase [Desulfuribacillus alkaliarsenatis]|uniref:HAD family hydrolase n=1 Tax=Desulfuribacillus alkaliarsenatis TaxID=766136 RepID=UPI00159F2557|nr:HAD family hydrolase [Desulfuribacillus alkaliarsenatis]
MKNYIFDLDGTLFQADLVAIPAFKQTFARLRKEGLYAGQPPKREQLLSMFGHTLDNIWDQILPDTEATVKTKADDYMIYYEQKYIDDGNGKLYEGTEQLLQHLKANGKRLFVASNGAEAYVKHVVHRMQIAQYFDKVYSAGEFNTSTKVDLVDRIITDYQLKNDITCMIGDRETDIEAGVKNSLMSIGCLYGYARDEQEFEQANYKIKEISDVTKISI